MFESLYATLPVFAQNWACSLYGFLERKKRFSDDFDHYFSELQTNDFASRAELKLLQKRKLLDILNYARAHTSFYKELIPEELTASNIFTVLESLPILSKKDILEKQLSFETELNAKIQVKTSGTSGKGFSFFKCKRSVSNQWAVWYRHRSRFGVSEGDLHVNFMGKPVVPKAVFPFWRKNSAFNQYLIPMQVVNEKNINDIVIFLSSISPKFYSGYPSIISEVARLALENGLQLNDRSRPKFVFTGAEPLLETQKEMIKLWTGAIVSQQYGMSEGVCNVSQCEYGNYHEDQEFGLIEKLNPIRHFDGSTSAEIVGTAFSNYAQPFLRYKTGDIATWEPDTFVCQCGRSSPVIRSIEGRLEDYVELDDGRRIMRFDYLFKTIPEIEEAQVIQKEIGKIEIHYVAERTVNVNEILEQVVKFIGTSIEVKFCKVDKIPRERNGKFRSVKSLINTTNG